MPIAPLPPEASFVGDGTSRVFSLGFYAEFKSQLRVYINSVEQTAGWAFAEGAVTFDVAPEALSNVVISRQTMPAQVEDFVRETSYESAGQVVLPALDVDLDRLWMVAQDQARRNSTFADALEDHEQRFGTVETAALNAAASAASASAAAAAAAADQATSTAAAAAASSASATAAMAATTASGHADAANDSASTAAAFATTAGSSASAAASSASAAADDASSVATTKSQIDALMPSIQSASGGQRPFATLADLNAYSGGDKSNFVANVMSDSTATNNGLYRWNGSAWVKSGYDPATLATTAKTEAIAAAATDATTKANAAQAAAQAYSDNGINLLSDVVVSKNLCDPAKQQSNKYITSSTGAVQDATGWACVTDVAVTAGQAYTLSWTGTRRSGWAFYDAAGALIGTVNTSSTSPITLTAPAGAVTTRFNINDASGSVPSNVQLETGSSATAYQAYFSPYRRLKDAAMAPSAATQAQLSAVSTTATAAQTQAAAAQTQAVAAQAQATSNATAIGAVVSSTPSVNLYDSTQKKTDFYLNTSGNLKALAGWGCTGYIPVTAGQQYTISYTGTKRIGLSFFATTADINCIAGSYVGTDGSPLTVTAPVGSAFMIVNLYSTTISEPSNVQIEAGAVATAYQTYGTRYALLPGKVLEAVQSTDTATAKLVLGSSSYIEAKQGSDVFKLGVLPFPVRNHDTSPVFNFAGDSMNGVPYKPGSDDVAPLRALGTTIGGNHGYDKSRLTVTGHTKTAADIGSVWTDGTNQWVIVAVAAGTIDVMRRDMDATLAAGVTLTHVSGATNTASFSGSAVSALFLQPSVKNRQLTVTVDNAVIPATSATTGTYLYKDSVGFYESYEIMDRSSIVEWIIANKGADWQDYGGTGVLLVKNSYLFDVRGACTIYAEVVALATVPFVNAMATQAQALSLGVSGAVRFYIPKALPFTYNGQTLDFAAIQDTTTITFDATRIDLTPARVDASGQMADRLVMLNDTVGFASGYLPVLDAAPAVRRTNASTKAMQISTASKFYPSLIDSSSKTTLNAGDVISCAAYRVPFARTTARTAGYAVRSQVGDYLFCDWHTATTDSVPVPPRFIGRTFTVVEKSSSVTVLSAVASTSVTFKTTGAGYAVLKFA